MKKLCCPLTGAYIPRLFASFLIGFAFLTVFESYVHGTLLAGLYAETPTLWRTNEEMLSHLPFLLGMQAAVAFITAAIYSVGHEGKGVCEGVRYGLLLGLLMGTLGAMAYSFLPITKELATAWFVVGITEGVALGVIYSLVYKSPCCAKTACATGEMKNETKGANGGCCG